MSECGTKRRRDRCGCEVSLGDDSGNDSEATASLEGVEERRARVDRLRRLVQEQRYSVPAAVVAESMLRTLRGSSRSKDRQEP